MNRLIFFIIFIIILIFLWSITLIFFKDRNTQPIESDESKCFAQRCKSIVTVHEDESVDTAILLIHGFPSTPHVYEYISKEFYDNKIDSYAYLMPGFGTSIKDFEKTNFTQWFDFQCRKYEELKKRYKNVFILGVSMGGLLTLKLGEKYSDTELEPTAIISISAPIVYNSIKDRLITNPAFMFARVINLFKSTYHPSLVNGIDSEDGNEEWTGYHGLFIKQSLSLVKGEMVVRKNLSKLKCPLFLIHDTGDQTVPFGSFQIIARENGSRDFTGKVTRMQNYRHSHHVLILYKSSRVKLTKELIAYIKEKINA
jgi:carboxylesterase